MRRKTGLIIAIVVIISISISYVLSFRYIHRDTRPIYEKTIIRNTSNVEETNALTIAETSNYSNILDLQRFTTWNHNETWPYTWAKFIDTPVIEYYDARFENLKGKPLDIEFHYGANVFAWDQIRVVYAPAPQGASIHDDAIQILSPNGSVLFDYTIPTWGMRFAYRNVSEYQEIKAGEINFSLSKSYVILMTLNYKERWGPLSAFSSRVYQIVIVDQDFVPCLFCVQSSESIS